MAEVLPRMHPACTLGNVRWDRNRGPLKLGAEAVHFTARKPFGKPVTIHDEVDRLLPDEQIVIAGDSHLQTLQLHNSGITNDGFCISLTLTLAPHTSRVVETSRDDSTSAWLRTTSATSGADFEMAYLPRPRRIMLAKMKGRRAVMCSTLRASGRASSGRMRAPSSVGSSSRWNACRCRTT